MDPVTGDSTEWDAIGFVSTEMCGEFNYNILDITVVSCFALLCLLASQPIVTTEP